jgi:hypothetical protein
MIRRSFLSFLPAGLLSLFTGRRSEKAYHDAYPFRADRNPDGDCLARVYRRNPADGYWYEIDRSQPRPGDRLIVLGLDGRRLWCAEAFTVGPGGSTERDGQWGADVSMEFQAVDLMTPPEPKVWRGVVSEADG